VLTDMMSPIFAPLLYGAMNIASATGIVFANKTGMSIIFKFGYNLISPLRRTEGFVT